MKRFAYRTTGISLLLVALLLHVVDRTIAAPLIDVRPEDLSVAERLIKLAFVDIGLNAIIVVLTALGGLYLLVGDLIGSFFSEKVVNSFTELKKSVDSGFDQISDTIFKGVVNLERDLIIAWIRNNNGSKDDYKHIGLMGLKKHFGPHAETDESYLDFLMDNFVDRSMTAEAVYRDNYRVDITLKKLESVHDALKYFRWEEVNRYELVTNQFPVEYPIKLHSSFRVDSSMDGDEIKRRLEMCDLNIEAGSSKIVDMEKFLHSTVHDLDALQQGIVSEDGNLSIKYNGIDVVIDVKATIVLSKAKTLVSIYEKSCPEMDERNYTLTFVSPVRTLDFFFTTDQPLFDLDSVSLGSNTYFDGADAKSDVKGWPNQKHFISINVDSWVLPGLVLALGWRSTVTGPVAAMESGKSTEAPASPAVVADTPSARR